MFYICFLPLECVLKVLFETHFILIVSVGNRFLIITSISQPCILGATISGPISRLTLTRSTVQEQPRPTMRLPPSTRYLCCFSGRLVTVKKINEKSYLARGQSRIGTSCGIILKRRYTTRDTTSRPSKKERSTICITSTITTFAYLLFNYYCRPSQYQNK